ncbi:hypothetical protein R5R35_007695 [Gryllus longicercus]|uniref:Torsin-1A C-terminal domain-containing protein n=1 Tax=Gryllus longicercus TaxID=2509291 RepID=A0AAN9Z2P1_9ORTH
MQAFKLLLACSIVFKLLTGASCLFGTEWLTDSVKKMGDSVKENYCYYMRCCDREWKRNHFLDLHSALVTKVYGQNIMTEIVVPALQGHLMPNTPRGKALAISFHGRPGIGKNYVTTFIQDILFSKESRHHSVHFFTGRIHFPLAQHVPSYRVNLAQWIKGNVSKCEYSLFIFDEVDKMPPGVLDAVTPFLDYHNKIDGIDYRKAIFIFISNTGGDLIAKQYLKYWRSGKKREELHLAHFEDLIRIGAFNEIGGFYKSETIESSLIDHYVPFLPLEEKHVRQCIADEFRKRSASPNVNLINAIIEDLSFGPEENPIFSNGGCKRIANKVAAAIERRHFNNFHRSHSEF